MKIGIIGGGPAGIMAAYSLSENKDINVVIFEKGRDIEDRNCPLLKHKVDKCVNCTVCSIMSGMAGAGAFSDGKYNITTEFGGWLQDIIDHEDLLDYIERADNILQDHGATSERFMPNNELKKLCLQNNLYMLQSECKHLGTDANFYVMKNIIDELKSRPNVKIRTNCEVTDVSEYHENDKIYINFTENLYHDLVDLNFDKVIFSVGRVGSSFFSKWAGRYDVKLINNQVDLGVRVELPAIIWEDFEKKIYEPKITYITEQYKDVCRTFCFNGRGEVVLENSDGILTVNGHAYKDESKKTKNSNFAILSTVNFTQPFNQPIDYAKHVAKLSNMIAGGGVIVQRLGDLESGRRTTEANLKKNKVQPTLKSAVAGDLSLCIPKRQLDNIIETLHALNKVAPGTANPDTLLYGVECKYYSARPEIDYKTFELKDQKNIYAIGDGAGFTRSLAQACAHGLIVADKILRGV